jgi:hypothetical protein
MSQQNIQSLCIHLFPPVVYAGFFGLPALGVDPHTLEPLPHALRIKR